MPLWINWYDAQTKTLDRLATQRSSVSRFPPAAAAIDQSSLKACTPFQFWDASMHPVMFTVD